ncbi:hypothetical protein O9992_16360 [Vibrio lentus]|nr:hypothetical protein [Vibrio lentus]
MGSAVINRRIMDSKSPESSRHPHHFSATFNLDTIFGINERELKIPINVGRVLVSEIRILNIRSSWTIHNIAPVFDTLIKGVH